MERNICGQLSGKGIKATKQRVALLRLLAEAKRPMTADEILVCLKNNRVDIWPSTVYRSLELFCEKGIAVRLEIPQHERAYYEYNTHRHRHHAVCLGCNALIELDNCPTAQMENRLETERDFLVTGHRLEFYGYCSSCREKH